MSKSTKSNDMINFYEVKKVQKFKTTSYNPNIENHKFSSAVFRLIAIGFSGGGKTNFIFNLLSRFSNTYNHIYIFTQEPECLYDFLQTQLDESMITVRYNLDDLNECNGDFNSYFYGQSLCIFDDQVVKSKKEQKVIQELFIRGRKVANGIALCYLSQSYYDIPKIIRSQSNYCVLIKISSNRDLKMILSEYSLNCTKEQLQKMYSYCTETFPNVFIIDLQSPQNQNKTYRKNFLEFLNPQDF